MMRYQRNLKDEEEFRKAFAATVNGIDAYVEDTRLEFLSKRRAHNLQINIRTNGRKQRLSYPELYKKARATYWVCSEPNVPFINEVDEYEISAKGLFSLILIKSNKNKETYQIEIQGRVSPFKDCLDWISAYRTKWYDRLEDFLNEFTSTINKNKKLIG